MADKTQPKTASETKPKSAEAFDIGPVVSSAHLASGAMPALSEMEFALTMTYNAYQRWMVRCMASAGYAGLSPLDVLVLHSVNHRDRPKSLADLCLVLNVEDTYTVAYSLKKLEKAGLVKGGRKGKERTAAITPEGQAACARYREIREALLVSAAKGVGFDTEDIHAAAALIRALSGQYDQAARSAASL